jgi:DNA helicase-2/ATP-dependent DNA helicase PcrA
MWAMVVSKAVLSGSVSRGVCVTKGKEFDAVVIVEGLHRDRLLDREWDARRIVRNRRVLRVAIIRARHAVLFVRPPDAIPLASP